MEWIDILLYDYTLRIVAFGSAMLGCVSGVVGSFAILKRQGLLGDAVSHASLPGIALMFILFQTKNTGLFMLGALIAGLLATGIIIGIDRYSRIKMDSAMALVLSVFFGFGLVLLTYIQKIPNANQAGLDKFIFGQASTLLQRDVYIIVAVGLAILMIVAVFWKELKLMTFDPEFADSIGFSSKRISTLLSAIIVVSIVIGLQTVGVILMSAMLVAPGVAARQWTNRLSVMAILGGIFGSVSGVIGTIISSLVPKMPTGPTIVIVISLIVLVSVTLAPNRGLVWRAVSDYRKKIDIDKDKVVLNLFELAMNHDNPHASHDLQAIKPMVATNRKGVELLRRQLEQLQEKGLVDQEYFDHWHLTDTGIAYAKAHPLKKEESYES